MENGLPTPRREFQPELLPRRGEVVAWMLALAAVAAWLILALSGKPVFIGLKLLAALITLSALAISLSNWMDRQTRLILEAEGIFFKNGLRTVHLRWAAIRQVEVFPSMWGRKVRVIAESAHFDFRTLGEVRMQGELKGRMGFERGEEILRIILEKTGFKETPGPGDGIYYSARE